jgi:hypothetical protein
MALWLSFAHAAGANNVADLTDRVKFQRRDDG